MSRKAPCDNFGLTMPGVKTPTVAAGNVHYSEELNVHELFSRLHGLTLRDTTVLPKVCAYNG